MKSPPDVSDVEGALPGDGDTTEADETDGSDDDGTDSCSARGAAAADVPGRGGRRSPSFETPSPGADSANAETYLGVRRSREGKWVRRHFSHTRFPHLAAKSKAVQHSSSTRGRGRTRSSDRGREREDDRPMRLIPRKPIIKKTEISRGRRALLRVSARAYEERRQGQGRRPFPCLEPEAMHASCALQSENIYSTGEIYPLHGYNLGSYLQREAGAGIDGLGFDDATLTDEERIRRFEDAYRAIMLATSVDPTHRENEASVSARWMEAGGKRWTRDPGIFPAVSVDGRPYDDLQRGPTISLREIIGIRDCPDLRDQAASWMVHVPNRDCVQRRGATEWGEFGVAHRRGVERGKTQQEDLLSAYQRKLIEGESKVRGIENRPRIDLLRDFQAIANQTPAPLKCGPMRAKENQDQSEFQTCHKKHGRNESRSASKQVISVDEDCDGVRNDQSSCSKQTKNSKVAPSVGIGTLRLLFAGVEKESKDHLGMKQTDDFPNYHGISKGENHKKYHEAMKRKNLCTSTSSAASVKQSPHAASVAIQGQIGATKERTSGASESSTYDGHLRSSGVGRIDASLVPEDGVSREETSMYYRSPEKSRKYPLRREVNGHHSCDRSTSEISQESKINPYDNSRDNDSASPTFQGKGNLDDEILRSIIDGRHLNVASLVKGSLLSQPSVIDTDGTESDITECDEEQHLAKMRSLLMSPSLITKRYQQALNAIEVRNWNQLLYLINANPWLMEMKDVRNDQSLVHSLSLFGGGQDDDDFNSPCPALPRQLVGSIVDYEPSVVHQLDVEGNLPLHMAAASGNIVMIGELGKRFSGAASVQNHNGLLPLHLAIMSCALFPKGHQSVELIFGMFPGAIQHRDNDGNTPLHTAAGTLRGDGGAIVINHLMTGCDALTLESGSSFDDYTSDSSDSKPLAEEASTKTEDAERGISNFPASSFLLMSKNKNGETPLTKAIMSLAGRQVVEALINRGGESAALSTNSASQNALHLALDSKFHDAAVVLSILKLVPNAATIVDGRGMLPIELACANSLQHEVILAITIIDLPIDIGAEGVIMRNGFGASWWHLLCESDDVYADVVKDILSICSHPQRIALCLMKARRGEGKVPVVTYASPKCKLELQKSLLLLGRFELIGSESGSQLFPQHVQVFDAIDYGTDEHLLHEGKKLILVCYTDAEVYSTDAKHLQRLEFGTDLFEGLNHFNMAEMDANVSSGISYCVATEKATMSLADVVAGMQKNPRYRSDSTIRGRYFGKCRSIMRQVAKALSQMHDCDIIHGSVDSNHIGKFGGRWKLKGLIGSASKGQDLATYRLGLHSPPEAFVVLQSENSHGDLASLAPSLTADPTVDIWAFGKLIYEVLVGESLFTVFVEKGGSVLATNCILAWNEEHLRILSHKLFEEGIGPTGIELISSCLCPSKAKRPKNMQDVLQNYFWKDDNAFRRSL